MYAGNVIVRFCLSPLIARRCSKNTFPFVSTTCQCGAGVSGILKSSDHVNVSLLPERPCVAVPLFALTPSNFAVVWASAAKPFDATNNPVTAIRETTPILNALFAPIMPSLLCEYCAVADSFSALHLSHLHVCRGNVSVLTEELTCVAAAEDTALMVMMVKFGAENTIRTEKADIAFRGQQHAN